MEVEKWKKKEKRQLSIAKWKTEKEKQRKNKG